MKQRPEIDPAIRLERASREKEERQEAIPLIQQPQSERRVAQRSRFFPNTAKEDVRDILWLLAALAIIAGVHHYIPNGGAAPHSITNVVKSTGLFPG